jgi:hypothetical protein
MVMKIINICSLKNIEHEMKKKCSHALSMFIKGGFWIRK